jgi:hypothetical protein
MKTQKEKELLIEQLKKTPIVEIACNKAEVSRATYYRWRKEDAEFARKANEALAEGLLLMNDIAESQLLSAIKDKNLGAIAFWLKHRHPSYAAKIRVDANINNLNLELNPEQKALVERALKLAALPEPDVSD